MPRTSWASRIFLVLLAIAALLMIARVHFGLEWYGDEANALAEPMRYAMGDLPIVDSWHTQFSSGILLTPLVRLLLSVTHANANLVIGFRLAFVLMQVIVAVVVWRLLRRVISEWAAALMAFAVFWYAPYFYVFPYYNNISFASLMVATLALYAAFTAKDAAEKTLLVLAGLSFAVAVIVYPPMLGMAFFFAVGIFGYPRGSRDSSTPLWPSILLFLGVAFGVLVVYAAFVLAIASRGELAASLPHFLHPIDRDTSLGALVARFLRTKAVIGASIASVLTLVAGLVLASRSRISRAQAVAAAVMVACSFPILATYLPHTLLYYMDIQQSAMFGVAVIVPVLMLWWRRDASVSSVFWLISVPAFGAAACTAFVSYEGFETATMPMIIGAIGTLIVLFQWATVQSDASPESAKATPLIAVAVVFALLFGTTLLLTGGDEPVWRLNSTIGSGPYKSIRTTTPNTQQYRRYTRLLAPIVREGGRVAFVEEFPLGYVLSGLRPGTYSVWTTFATGDLWQPYLDITGNYPRTIVSTRFEGPNGGVVAAPFAPPFGIREFDRHYREIYRDDQFVVYRQRTGK